MSDKRRSPSIRALDELKSEIIKRCKASFHDSSYGESMDVPLTEELKELDRAREELNETISKEIEQYAVETYKDYGLIVVPTCHRKSSEGYDRLNIQLKIKEFDLPHETAAANKVISEYTAARKSIEDWHFNALKAVANRAELPEIPEFKERS